MSIIELQARIGQIQNDLRACKGRGDAIVAKCDRENRELTATEVAEVDRHVNRFEALEAELATAQEELNGTSLGRVVPPQQPGGGNGAAARTSGRMYAQMFPGARNDTGRFADFGDFARAVHQRDPRLFSNSSGMSRTPGADGGFYVPTGFLAGLIDGSLQQESIRPRATVFPIETGSVDIPMFDTTNRSSTIAGLDGKATAEGATATSQKATLRTMSMSASKVVVLVPTTEELLADAPGIFATLLRRYMGEAIAAKNDYNFLHGTGVGMPMGIINAACTVSVAKESGQVAATLVPENIAKMLSRLAPGSFSNAVWLANSNILEQLYLLKVLVKNVAGSENVGGFGPDWFTVSAEGAMSLMGRPLIVTDRCAALGTVGDLVLADLTQYLIAMRQDATLAVDQSIGFKEGEIWFKLTMRLDGQPMLAAAITPRLGGSTLSPFVTLATRA